MSMKAMRKTLEYGKTAVGCALLPLLMAHLSSSHARADVFSAEPVWRSGIEQETYDVALGDVDGDGDLDLVCGALGGNALYINEGETYLPTPTWTSVDENTLSIALGDIDLDGDLDLVCGNYGRKIAVFLNTGHGFPTRPDWRGPELHGWGTVALGDVDNDGDLDLVWGQHDQGIYQDDGCALHLNEDGVFSPTPVWTISNQETRGIALGDVDGDGYVDLVCGNGEPGSSLFLNVGGTFATTSIWTGPVSRGARNVGLGDVDGDGDLDLVLCAEEASMLFLNERGTYAATPTWASPYQRAHSIVLGDVDGDGDLDLVSGSSASTATALFLNHGGAFSLIPDWSNPYPGVDSVTLGDIDGDGDLDLVCGRHYQSSLLFRNESGAFSNAEAWASLSQNTYDVAVGDVDADGDLDLVCGNYGAGSTLFVNEGGIFPATPAWTGPIQSTNRVALGDVDRDGDLDLVCGNGNSESSALFLNEGGVFSATPAWLSSERSYYCCVALGDVDGDGYLDLVCGNYGAGNTLYMNEGGIFASVPAWSCALQYTAGIALRDVDGDGDLDLLCGNYDTGATPYPGSTLFLNEGGIFSESPVWGSPRQSTSSIAVGDVDGDGDLDLVCGNRAASMLFLGEGGSFSSTPAWQSPMQSTNDVALGDMDGDGDLDLVCGNYEAGSTLFANEGGVLSAAPVWTSPNQMTRGVALGDIDRDGDLDLVCGNGNPESSSLLFNGKGNPVFRGDPGAPTNQLPNNGAFVRNVRVTESGKNAYRVSFTIYDVESDPGWIVTEFQFEEAPIWYPADVLGYPGAVGPLSTSPYGMEHEFDWDVSRVPFDSRGIILRLRTVSVPSRSGVVQYVASYRAEVGHIDVRRPELSASASLLSFPTVTVGDSLALDLMLSNSGNEPLTISGIALPSGEMRIDATLPITLNAQEEVPLRVHLEPRRETSIGGNLIIESNDPLNPHSAIAIESDVRALEMKSRLLSTAPALPLGEAVTVVVTPLPEVRIERGFLLHRSGYAQAAFQDSVPLSKYEDNYIAVIPGAAITETGLEYYIKVENSGVFSTDPANAPADSVFYREVASPQLVTTAAQPNSGADFLEGRGVKVFATLPLGAEFVQGTLHYRFGGETVYQTSPFQPDDPLPSAVIPDSLVGPRGLEYWVEIQTLTATLTDPPRTPGESPYSIRVTVPNLAEEKMYPERAFRMVSIPLDFGSEFTGTLEALLSDQGAFGPYDPTQWRSFRYVPAARGYAELSEKTREEFKPVPGRGFWLISASKNRIGTGPIEGLSTATDSACAFVLEPGWNMIGDPFDFPVAWDSVLMGGVKLADAESVVVEPPVAYVIGKGYRLGVETLEPFGGYWVKNLSDGDVVLQIPAREAPPAVMLRDSLALATVGEPDQFGGGWHLEIGASSCGAIDCGNIIGVADGAAAAWDKHDRSEPPMAPERAISLYFPHQSWEKRGDDYAVDMRGGYEALAASELKLARASEALWGQIWRFDVAKNFSVEGVGDEVTLEMAGIESVPAEASIYLIDRELAKLVDVRTERSYSFHLGRRERVSEAEARFALIVGSAEFMEGGKDELPAPPSRTVLHQNYPNPFNPSTIIRYDLADASSVRLIIYDASGAVVKVLYDGRRSAGRYEEAWDGRNEKGREVSTGVYFSCLETSGGHRQTRKMLFVR